MYFGNGDEGVTNSKKGSLQGDSGNKVKNPELELIHLLL